jgi:hypothetical protein
VLLGEVDAEGAGSGGDQREGSYALGVVGRVQQGEVAGR